MQIHGRAKLGPAGRLALTQAVVDGMTLRQAAGHFGVSVATAHRWWHRRLLPKQRVPMRARCRVGVARCACSRSTSEALRGGALLPHEPPRHRHPVRRAPGGQQACLRPTDDRWQTRSTGRGPSPSPRRLVPASRTARRGVRRARSAARGEGWRGAASEPRDTRARPMRDAAVAVRSG